MMRGLTLLLAVAAFLPFRTALATTAADIPCQSSSPPPGPCIVKQTVAVTAGSIIDFGSRGLTLTSAGTFDAGGGAMKILAGNLVLQAGALLTSAAGSIEVDTSGPIQVQAASSKAKVDVSGASGGDITFIAGGDVTIAGQLLADATGVINDGGIIDLTGTNFTLSSGGKLSAMGGRSGTGGDISASATTGSTSISGTIDASSSLDGGSISIDANNDITTTSAAILNAKGGPGGICDTIDLTAFNGKATLAGQILGSAAGDITLGSGAGGDFSVDTIGPISSAATIDVGGGGTDGSGGSVDISTFADITITGTINASAPGSSGYGGIIGFTTTQGFIDIRKDVSAIGPAFGGDISVFSFNDIRVSAKLTSDGASAGVELTGCAVNVTNTARLSTLGASGQNTVQASGTMTIAGPLVAGGTNRLEFRDLLKPPLILFPPLPPPVIVQNTNLFPCGGPPPTTTTTTTTTLTTSSTTSTSLPGTTTTTTTTQPTTTVTTSSTTTATGPPPTTTTTSMITTSTTTTTTPSTTTTTTRTTTTTSATTTTSTTTSSTTTSSTTTSSTSTSSTTTSSTSTTGSTSTSTSTTTVPSTTTTTHVSTTTTTTAPVCNPSNCDDGEECTDDRCDPSGCVHTQRTGFEAVTCELDEIESALVAAPDEDIGGAGFHGRALAKVIKAHKLTDVARPLTGRRLHAKIRRVEGILGGLARGIQRGEARGKVKQDLAGQLLDRLQRAEMALEAISP